jgi:GGDEF domain-containing protein
MRLDKLHKPNKLRLLYEEDTGKPLEANRYPPVKRHAVAECSPLVNIEDELDALKELVFEYPKGMDPPTHEESVKALRRSQAAFKRLLQRMQLNPISGLHGATEYSRISEDAHKAVARKEKFGKPGPTDFIIVAADVDDMKFLNSKTGLGHAGVNSILQTIGKLFKENFDIEGTRCYHPCGDEFAVVSKMTGEHEEARQKFAKLLKGCIGVANALAETGFHHKGWPDDRRVQPTISFAISNTDTSSKGLLTHVKAGKSMKFVVVVDRDLRYDLGFSPEELNKYVQRLQSGETNVLVRDVPEMAVYEEKMPIDEVRNNQGPVILECSWADNPDKEKLEAIVKMKGRYRDAPEGVQKFGKHYLPLGEAFIPPR